LFVAGSDSNPGVGRTDGKNRVLGNNDLYRLLGAVVPRPPRLQLTADFFDRPNLPDLSPYRCLINQISDPDQNPKVLENLRRLVREFTGRVINHPDDVFKSTRDGMAKQLEGTRGLYVPKVVRLQVGSRHDVVETIEGAGLSFPIILRRAGTHAGHILGLFANMDDLQRALPSQGELIATQFVDFRSADGLYRKYRVFVFGRSIVLRHMLASDEWNIHARARKSFMIGRSDLRDEERRMLERPRHALDSSIEETLKAARKRVGLDYFGMDFGIDRDGTIVLFEANATMNFFPFSADPEFGYVRHCIPIARRACRALIPELFPHTVQNARNRGAGTPRGDAAICGTPRHS